MEHPTLFRKLLARAATGRVVVVKIPSSAERPPYESSGPPVPAVDPLPLSSIPALPLESLEAEPGGGTIERNDAERRFHPAIADGTTSIVIDRGLAADLRRADLEPDDRARPYEEIRRELRLG